jgi:hypothetical protein
MARDKIGLYLWEECSEEEKKKFIDMEIWKDNVFEKWRSDQEAEELKKLGKQSKLSKRRNRNKQDEDGDEYME